MILDWNQIFHTLAVVQKPSNNASNMNTIIIIFVIIIVVLVGITLFNNKK